MMSKCYPPPIRCVQKTSARKRVSRAHTRKVRARAGPKDDAQRYTRQLVRVELRTPAPALGLVARTRAVYSDCGIEGACVTWGTGGAYIGPAIGMGPAMGMYWEAVAMVCWPGC